MCHLQTPRKSLVLGHKNSRCRELFSCACSEKNKQTKKQVEAAHQFLKNSVT